MPVGMQPYGGCGSSTAAVLSRATDFRGGFALRLAILLLSAARVEAAVGAETPPAFLWADMAGGATNDEARSIAMDAAGNAIVTGFFMGTASFGTQELTSHGLEDIFLAKYNPAGQLLWVKQAGGSGFDQGRGVAVDGAGNIFVTGLFQSTATFESTTVTSDGQSDAFLAKYGPEGNLVWVRRAGSKDYDEGHAVAIDSEGNALITGSVDATADFGGHSVVNRSSTDDIFIAKCDPAGAFLWAIGFGGASDDSGNGITVDGSGNAFVAGSFSESVDFGTTRLVAGGTSGAPDAFLAKISPAGSLLWAHQAGGAGYDEAAAIAADPEGNIWLAGRFFSPATFDGTSLTGKGTDAFLARYDPGGTLLWVRRAGGNNTIYGDAALGVCLDTNKNAYLTGFFSGTADFGTNSAVTAGFDDAFSAKYNAAGEVVWLRRAGGTDLDLSYGAAVDSAENLVLAGFTASKLVSFGPVTNTNAGGRDLWVARLGQPVAVISPALSLIISNNVLVLSWPADALGFTLESTPEVNSSAWEAVGTGTSTPAGWTITIPTIDARRFFRLRK